MLIGYDSIGDMLVQSKLPTSISNQFYLIEASNAVYDEIYIDENGDIADTAKQDWRITTYLKATFQNNLEAGNVSLGGLTINKWKVRRRRIDATSFKTLNIVDVGIDNNFYYLDTSPRTSIIYEYEVIPMSGDIEGIPHTVQIKCEFDYWWLSDDVESYPFFANLELSEINTNVQRYVYDGFNQFPTISYGNQKYQSGTITAILLDSFLETSKTYRDNVENFINNGKRKYLRSPYGDLWIVDTHSSKRKIFTDIIQDLSTITFDWQEIEDSSSLE